MTEREIRSRVESSRATIEIPGGATCLDIHISIHKPYVTDFLSHLDILHQYEKLRLDLVGT